ncbi:hypothetical protein [Nocardia sp. NPDC047038]|uniref:hypothetical protein n=1 Tax=Nocardia sp. NPDC047038 TaxID=3154338 RepID=UPI0033E5E37B
MAEVYCKTIGFLAITTPMVGNREYPESIGERGTAASALIQGKGSGCGTVTRAIKDMGGVYQDIRTSSWSRHRRPHMADLNRVAKALDIAASATVTAKVAELADLARHGSELRHCDGRVGCHFGVIGDFRSRLGRGDTKVVQRHGADRDLRGGTGGFGCAR